jgi:GNAT superfamily N-acetyltransferase
MSVWRFALLDGTRNPIAATADTGGCLEFSCDRHPARGRSRRTGPGQDRGGGLPALRTPRPGYLLLDNVAVLPAAQGQGIGARLLALAEDRARALHLPEIRLYTNAAMTENLAYYPRHGYTETHQAHQDGFHRVFFRKRLDT